MHQIEQLVVFAILMENNEGILGKAPSYINEKWTLCKTSLAREHLEQLLDYRNRVKFDDWLRRWRMHLTTPESPKRKERKSET